MIPDGGVPAVPNVGIIVGSRATLVVDTGLGPRNMEIILRETAKVSKNSEMYLVATHFHPEHAGGSSAFPASGKFIVSRVQQQDIQELGAQMMSQFAARTPAMGELLKGAQIRKPDIEFEREHMLDLGGVTVKLLALGPTHTRGDTMVFVEPDRVLFAGDVVMNKAFPAFNNTSSTEAWLKALDEAQKLQPATIVPSHGNRGNATLIAEQRDYLQTLQARVR
jgi:glyoxylase-like metal-dependent hydrolase (beta-lactamase superfamily II)